MGVDGQGAESAERLLAEQAERIRRLEEAVAALGRQAARQASDVRALELSDPDGEGLPAEAHDREVWVKRGYGGPFAVWAEPDNTGSPPYGDEIHVAPGVVTVGAHQELQPEFVLGQSDLDWFNSDGWHYLYWVLQCDPASGAAFGGGPYASYLYGCLESNFHNGEKSLIPVRPGGALLREFELLARVYLERDPVTTLVMVRRVEQILQGQSIHVPVFAVTSLQSDGDVESTYHYVSWVSAAYIGV